jgi:hypothetical protein
MVALHDHHIKMARQIGPVLEERAARADHKPAAVTVEHDRALAIIVGRCPDVEEQTILGWLRFILPGRLERRRP